MASEIRVNSITNRSGLSTVTFSESGVVIAGITTVDSLNATNITGNLTGNVSGTISASGVSTFTTINATSIVGISTLGVTTAYINTLSGISTISADNSISINQNLVFPSGKGIDFSADGNSAGMTSEILSDYETGTWTPTLLGSISNPTVTYTYQNGWYTKIGNIVYINLILTTSAASGGSGDLRIGGLPFSADTTGFYQIHALNIGEALSMTTPIAAATIVEEVVATAIFTNVTTAALGTTTNNNRIRINGWYRAA